MHMCDFAARYLPGHLAVAYSAAAARRFAARATGPHPDMVAYDAADADMRRIMARLPMTWARFMRAMPARVIQ